MSVEDRVLYQTDDVTVTTTRVIIGPQTYAMAGVNSVAWLHLPAKNGMASVLIVVGTLFGLVGGVSMAGGDTSGCSSSFLGIGIPLAIVGLLMFWAAKPMHVVALTMASQQVHALKSPDPEKIRPIVEAINKALVERG